MIVLKRLNKKGYSLVELMLAVLIFSFIATLVLNYSMLQQDAFDHKYLNDVVISVATKELSNLYLVSDWAALKNSEKTEEDIKVVFNNYHKTLHGTESITVEFLAKHIDRSFRIERYDKND